MFAPRVIAFSDVRKLVYPPVTLYSEMTCKTEANGGKGVFMNGWFYGADDFFIMLSLVRYVWFAGFFGSGKTALAVMVAAELFRRKLVSRFHTNIPITGSAPVDAIIADGTYHSNYLNRDFGPGQYYPVEDAVLLMDEAATFMDDWASASDYLRGLRKTNLYLLMPSIWDPASRIRSFEVRRLNNLMPIGIPAWRYGWWVRSGKAWSQKGTFWVWKPDRIFPYYDTKAMPNDDGGIADALEYTFRSYDARLNKQKRAVARQITTLSGGNGNLQAPFSSVNLEAQISELSDQNDRLEDANRKAARTKR